SGAGKSLVNITAGGLAPFAGRIDELAIYNTALTEATLKAHFEARGHAGTNVKVEPELTSENAATIAKTLKVKERLKAEGAATVAKTLKVTELTSTEGGLTVTGAFKSEGAATCK